MTINIVAVGKIKERFLSDGIAEYVKRISGYANLKITEIDETAVSKENQAETARAVKKECALIQKKLKGFVIALDSAGVNLSSVELSEKIENIKNGGIGEITFVIGGSYGLDDEIKGLAGLILSFGKMTYPHQLMRLILSEQIYRALTISAKHPYHK